MDRNDPSCRLYHWGVDVQEGNGPICRGIIRDWIPRSGLIVDFLHPGHEEVHTPFRKIVGVSCRHRSLYKTGDAVETIFQRSSDQPWRWYPSKVLATDCGTSSRSYAFVEIDYGDEVVQEVMTVGRVRLPSTPPFGSCSSCRDPIRVVTGMRALGKHLHQHTVELPADAALRAVTKRDGFLRIWERETGMTGAKLSEGRLEYISCSTARITDGAMKKCLRRICGIYQTLLAAPPSEPERLTALPRELIGEVLSFLDVNDQTRCQRVRRAWYSTPRRRLVHIDLTKYSGVDCHKLMVTLHKTVTYSTKTLLLSANELEASRLLMQATHMVQAMGIRISTIILSGRDSDGHWMNLAQTAICSAFATISDKLLWRQERHGADSRVFQLKESNTECKKKDGSIRVRSSFKWHRI